MKVQTHLKAGIEGDAGNAVKAPNKPKIGRA